MDRIKGFFRALSAGVREASLCFALGLRESLAPRLLLPSAGWCLLVSCICGYVFYVNFAAICEFCGWLSAFAALGVANFAILAPASATPSIGMGVDPLAFFNLGVGVLQLALYIAAFFTAMMVMLFLGLLLIGLRLVIHLGFFQKVRACVQQRYPGVAADCRATSRTPWREARYGPARWLGLSRWTLASLLIPLYNGALIILSLPFVHMRLLLTPAIGGCADAREQLAIAKAARVRILFLGLFNMLLACVPVLNLLLPATLSASACHLYMRALAEQRSVEVREVVVSTGGQASA